VLEKQAVAFIQPDASHAGGISELRRIAQMAEVYYIHTMPHCAIGPVALAACVHVDAATPNFLIQETVAPDWLTDVVEAPWPVSDGYLALPTGPGLGITIDETAVQASHAYTEELGGEYFHDADGSIADW
jgi:galactonate dehydratase